MSAAELKMATQLVEEMSGKWNPADFKDEFRIQVMKLVEKKAKAGEGKTVLELRRKHFSPPMSSISPRCCSAASKAAESPADKSSYQSPRPKQASKASAKKAPAKSAARKVRY